MAAFPTLTNLVKPDSKQFAESVEDVSMKAEVEGGYVLTRARHTRLPRRSWTIAYRNLLPADKVLIETFYTTTVRGGSVIFDWTNPESGVVYQVRFEGNLEFKYTGLGNTKLWDCSFTVKQA